MDHWTIWNFPEIVKLWCSRCLVGMHKTLIFKGGRWTKNCGKLLARPNSCLMTAIKTTIRQWLTVGGSIWKGCCWRKRRCKLFCRNWCRSECCERFLCLLEVLLGLIPPANQYEFSHFWWSFETVVLCVMAKTHDNRSPTCPSGLVWRCTAYCGM